MPERTAVHFPPRRHSDFIIHYRNVDFHVHQLVLEQSSAYFRAYFVTLPAYAEQLESLDEPSRRKRPRTDAAQQSAPLAAPAAPAVLPAVVASSTPASSASSSSSSSGTARPSRFVLPPADSSSCAHSCLRQCIKLPEKMSLPSASWDCSTRDFALFLRHLYFASHYRFPPYTPKTAVDLAAEPPAPIFVEFTPPMSCDAVFSWMQTTDSSVCSYNTALLALFHYFDCERAWQQCMDTIMITAPVGNNALFWLTELAQFGPKAEVERLVQLAAHDVNISNDDEYMRLANSLPSSVLWRVLVAVQTLRKAKLQVNR